MKLKVRILLVCGMLIILAACASVEQRRAYFSEVQEGYVGRNIEEYWIAKPVSIDHENGVIVYSFSNKEIGCRWAFIVDKESKIILRWNYISEASRCYEQINWQGPW